MSDTISNLEGKQTMTTSTSTTKGKAKDSNPATRDHYDHLAARLYELVTDPITPAAITSTLRETFIMLRGSTITPNGHYVPTTIPTPPVLARILRCADQAALTLSTLATIEFRTKQENAK